MSSTTWRIAFGCVLAACAAAGAALAGGEDREAKVRNDRERVTAAGAWIYGDLQHGIGDAKKSGKPLLVVFRCIPCEACAKLDEDVVEQTPALKDLLAKFVCVRLPWTNGMDLSLFQFDFDQSWAAFAMNADGTIYARYGTRSHRTESENDVSVEGFGATLEGALRLHEKLGGDAGAGLHAMLAAKRGKPLEAGRPEEFPSLKGKYTAALDWGGKVVPSCIHCHMIGEAQRKLHRDAGRGIPDDLLFPYPHPKTLGLVIDPKSRCRVASVVPGSSAEKDGFRAGDEIDALQGQPVLSVADVQWVLHGARDGRALPAHVIRDGKDADLKLSLPAGWRRKGDISWRVSTWDLRRIATGGMVLEDLSDEERAKLGVEKSGLALVAKHVGQYGDHAAAKNAGFLKGDVLVEIDGAKSRMTETDWITRVNEKKKRGDKVDVTVLRDGKKVELKLPIQ